MDKDTSSMREKVDMRFLEIRVGISKWVLAFVFVVVIAAYVGQFGALPFAADQGAWGQFGDYVGGIMNPLVAFFAFYWLATSVLLQKRELAETRNALIATQKAQEQQALTALQAARIQSINIRMSSVVDRLNFARRELEAHNATQLGKVHATGLAPGGERAFQFVARSNEIKEKIRVLEDEERELVSMAVAIDKVILEIFLDQKLVSRH